MSVVLIDNLEIKYVTNDILFIHQIKARGNFSTCDGLLVLPKDGRNSKTIILDANIEPKYIKALNKIYGPISDYVCTHAHMDHTSHVHTWEQYGATLHAPNPEAPYLLDLHNFYEGFGFNEAVDYSSIKKFGKLNGYHKCKKVISFKPGDFLEFEEFQVETISFPGHSKGHIGFLLPNDKVLHISCLGFDQPKPGIDGFGPWYGFKECSIEQYLTDINYAEEIFIERAEFLTSSHSYIARNPDRRPFNYMRKKIEENQNKVNEALNFLDYNLNFEIKVKQLLELDIFFPKKKMKDFLLKIYTLWESWIIRKHLERIRIKN
ncbi:MAG: MBL fold metallo-hydrolase [Promethearchaeota archaeon]